MAPAYPSLWCESRSLPLCRCSSSCALPIQKNGRAFASLPLLASPPTPPRRRSTTSPSAPCLLPSFPPRPPYPVITYPDLARAGPSSYPVGTVVPGIKGLRRAPSAPPSSYPAGYETSSKHIVCSSLLCLDLDEWTNEKRVDDEPQEPPPTLTLAIRNDIIVRVNDKMATSFEISSSLG
jgi:hypothetical protein